MSATREQGFTVWFTGLSGAGKTTVSSLVATQLEGLGKAVELLDGDVIRAHLWKDLGFSKSDRVENVERIGYLAKLLNRHGIITLVAAISPYRASREAIRTQLEAFVEVYLECPVDVLVARDTRGLYRKALAGEIENFSGISDPYEAPLDCELVIDTSRETPDCSAEKVLGVVKSLGLIGR